MFSLYTVNDGQLTVITYLPLVNIGVIVLYLNLVTLTKFGTIIVDATDQRASVEGIWAAGDCTDGLYHQNNIAAGDAVKAIEDIYLYLHTQ